MSKQETKIQQIMKKLEGLEPKEQDRILVAICSKWLEEYTKQLTSTENPTKLVESETEVCLFSLIALTRPEHQTLVLNFYKALADKNQFLRK